MGYGRWVGLTSVGHGDDWKELRNGLRMKHKSQNLIMIPFLEEPLVTQVFV